MVAPRVVGAGVAALTFACVFSLVALNERASRSPATVLAQAGPQYVSLPSFHDKQGTNRAFLSKGDGSGQSTKGRVQMLADIRGSGAARRAAKTLDYVPLPEAGGMGTNKAFVNKGDGKGLRGTSKLSGFGTDAAFLHKADGSGQSTKGRVQMLADIRGSGATRRGAKNANYVALPEAGGMGTNKAFLHKADGSGQSTKGKTQMLASILGSGAARRQAQAQKSHNAAGFVALPEAGAMGTNKAFVNKGDGKGLRGTSKLSGFGTDAAFLHKADGSGQSTKGKMQMLASILGSGAARRQAQAQKSHNAAGFVALPEAGAMGTNKAFVNKGDGKGLRGTSKLSGFGTDAAFLHKADGSGQSTKGKTQQLYEWTGDMEGTYLPADDYYTGAGTKQIQLGAGFTHMEVTPENLGGIPGTEPANILPYASEYVIGH